MSAAGVPTLSSVAGPITLHVGEQFTNIFTATDTDASDTLTFNAETFHFDSTNWISDGVTTMLDQGYDGGPPTVAQAQLTWQATAIGNYRVDVTVTDSQGHHAVQKVFINVVNGPPVIAPIAAQSVSIGDSVSVQVNATDPDIGDTLTYQLVGSPAWLSINSSGLITSAPLTASQTGTFLVTVSVDDGNSHVVTTTFTLTVSALGVPILTSAKDLSQAVTLHVNEPYTDLFTSTDTDASDTATFAVTSTPSANVSNSMVTQSYDGGPPTKSTSLLTWSASAPGNYQVDVSVTDNQSHTSTKTFFVNVITVNAAPIVSNPGTWIASAGTYSTFSIFATDTDTLTYTPSANMPAWVHFEAPTSAGIILDGTPGLGDVGTTSVSIDVSDGVNTINVPFEIQVVSSGVPTLAATPTPLGSPEEAITGEGYSRMFISQDSDYPENLIFGVKVTDAGANVLMDDVSTDPNSHIRRIYQSGSLSQGGTTAGAEFDWTPSVGGIYQVEISVTDQQAHVTSLTYSIRFSSPPTIQLNGSSVPVTINAVPELPITPIPVQVSDADDHETLAVTLDFNAPEGMTVKTPSSFSNVPSNTPKNTELDFTPTTDQANQSFTFDVTVTDSAGLTASQSVTVNVGAVNARPVITSPTAGSTKNVVTGHEVYLPVVATDAEGDTLTYGATGLAGTGLSIDSTTGVIGGTVTASSGTFPVTVTVDDGNHIAPAASVSFKIVVGSTNHAPTLSAIPNQTLIVGQTLDVQAVGSDPDNDKLTYTQTGLPGNWATFDNDTGKIGGIAEEGTWNVTITVSDGYGGTASQSFVLRVNGLFSSNLTTNSGYVTITYTVTNITGSTISPVVRGSLTGGGYLDNENAFFNSDQGFVDDQWANPVLQRQLDPTKNTRILTWTVGDLAPGASTTLTISVPVKGSTPHGTELTNTWSIDFGATHNTLPPVKYP